MSESSKNIQRVDFKLYFQAKPGEVSVDTFVTTLQSVTGMLEELNSELGMGEKLHVRVKAPSSGSVVVDMAIVWDAIKSLLTDEKFEWARKIMTHLISLYTLRRHTKNTKPESVEERGGDVVIKDNSSPTIVVDKRVYNIYVNNPEVNKCLNQTFQSLEKDVAVTDFGIRDHENKELFSAHRNEFGELSQSLPLPETVNRTVEAQQQELEIVKPSFDKDLKWEFLYQNNRKSFSMKDQKFIKKVDRGIEKFSKGDRLAVDLRIEQVYEPSKHAFVDKEYHVIKVHDHIPLIDSQEVMNFPEN